MRGPAVAARFAALDALLAEYQWLWREQPFKISRPLWTTRLPALAARAERLSDATAEALVSDNAGLIEWLAETLPDLKALPGLLDVGVPVGLAEGASDWAAASRVNWEVPGRKWAQVEWFAAQVGEPVARVTEWCSGKGHLGRLVGARGGMAIDSVDIDAPMCESGGALARRAGVAQRFIRADVLRDELSEQLAGRHVLALHACGELHRALVTRARASGVAALDVAPCCYYRGADAPPASVALRLNADDLRLAVTETSTAGAREIRARDQGHAWRLGYVALRAELSGRDEYRGIKPIKSMWLAEGFEGFCRRLAAREGLALAGRVDWGRFELAGWARHREVVRFSAPRFAFRRALEVWLACRLALDLEAQGYEVGVDAFCPPHLTPRNLRVTAR